MQTTIEGISESVLFDVFDTFKGVAGKQKAFLVYSDFKGSVLRYEPESLKDYKQSE